MPGPDHIELNAQPSAIDAAPYLTLRRESDVSDLVLLRFTPDEARQLAENLQLILGQIEAAR